MIRAKDWHPDVIADYPQEYMEACDREFEEELEQERLCQDWCRCQEILSKPIQYRDDPYYHDSKYGFHANK